jgi:uncharacterized membrane-anchored protein
MNSRTLWNTLTDHQLASGDAPEMNETTEHSPWYVRVLQGFAGWLAALFLLGFLGFGVAGFFDNGPVVLFMGLLLNGCALIYYRNNQGNDFFDQLVLAFSLTGQFLVAFGLYETFDFKSREWMVLVAAYQVVLLLIMPHYLHRFLSTWFAVIALFWGFEGLVYSGVGSALVAALLVWIWLDKAGWEANRNLYEPVGYALALALLQLNVHSQLWLMDLFWYQKTSGGLLLEYGNSLRAILNTAVLGYFVWRVCAEQGISLKQPAGRLAVLGLLGLLLLSFPVLGLSNAMLLLLVGFARQKVVLQVLGGLALLSFVGWYYHNLDTTLLIKSMLLLAVGVALLIGRWLVTRSLNPAQDEVQQAVSEDFAERISSSARLAALLTLVLALAGINQAIWSKEQQLTHGRQVLLELAPVDPRSIMQGDYMRLRFAIANDIRQAVAATNTPNMDGLVWVRLDEHGVGRFQGLSEPEPVTDDLLALQFRVRNNRVQMATNAFFFQEGDAKKFDQARFGAFRVAADGELLLTAMHDKNHQLLGENRLD